MYYFYIINEHNKDNWYADFTEEKQQIIEDIASIKNNFNEYGDSIYLCGFNGSTTVPATEIKLNYSTYSMKVGDSSALSTAFTPADATDLTLTFASSDTSVVTISDIGLFTAVGVGTATLTVTATNGTADTSDDVTATCEVTVTASGESSGSGRNYTNGDVPAPATTTTTATDTPKPETKTGSFADVTEENNNYSGAEINMSNEELEKAILTDSDKKVISDGGTVNVELKVKEAEPTAEEKKAIDDAIEAAGDDYAVAMYFDADLFKTVNGSTTQIHETNGAVTVSFELPEGFKNNDSSIERTYAVARIHDGEVEIIPAAYDPETNTVSFTTDRFSLFALIYFDAPAKADTETEIDVSGETETPDTGDNTDTTVVVPTTGTDGEGNPHTGTAFGGTALMISALAAIAARKRKEKDNK